MTISDRPTNGQHRTSDGSDALDITVDDALIAPENWRTVDLDRLGSHHDQPLSITARFGLTALAHGNDNPESRAPEPAVPAATMPTEAADLFLASGPVANDDDVLRTAPLPRRVIRRAGMAESLANARNLADMQPLEEPLLVAEQPAIAQPATAPMTVMPLPVQQPIDWAAWRDYPQVRSPGLDRSAITTLIIIMIGVWAAGVGFGLYKLSTPSYGTKILWER